MEVESYKQHQFFKQTIDRFVQALPGGYRGSRKVAMRYIYPRTTLANFIELKSEQPPMTPAEFFELLSAVPGVLTVVPHPKSKSEQNNYGHHYQERQMSMKFGLGHWVLRKHMCELLYLKSWFKRMRVSTLFLIV